MTKVEAAAQLKVSRTAFSRVLNEHAAISSEMALRLADWLGGDATTWLRMQTDYDLWIARKTHKVKIAKAMRAIPVAAKASLAARPKGGCPVFLM